MVKHVNLPSPSFHLSSGKISYWDNWLCLNIPTSKRIRLRGLFLWPRLFLRAVSREAAPSPGVPSKLLNVPHAVGESFIPFSVGVIALPSSVILNPRCLHPFIMLLYNNYSRYLFGGRYSSVCYKAVILAQVLNICSGAHPPPHRHRPRLPAKLTHNHNTGFPRGSSRGSQVNRSQRRRVSPLRYHWPEICQSLRAHSPGHVIG